MCPLNPRGGAYALAVALLSASSVAAQQASRDTSRAAASPATLSTVRVTATREGPRAPIELPYAVTLTRPDSLAAQRRHGAD